MKIIAHRGYHYSFEPNSLQALSSALNKGYGIETDIRDYKGKLVISHNIADENSPEFESFLNLANLEKNILALNIKADGLKELLNPLLKKYSPDYFLFDMSVPQMIEYKSENMCIYTRKSEYEDKEVMFDYAAGIWIDAFKYDEWINEVLISSYLQSCKKICIVSPDLHKREYLSFWERLKNIDVESDNIALCTDYPDEADKFFNKG